MIARRLLSSLGLLMLLASSTLAQLSASDKQEVLREMEKVITERAFVVGVELDKWPEFIAARQRELDEADSNYGFSRVVNSALREFGISHIRLTRMNRGGREESYAQFQRGGESSRRRNEVKWLDDDTAVIRIPSFSEGYRRTDIEDLFAEAATAKYLLLDLRSNGGGRVDYMRHLLGLLLPDGTPIGTFVSKREAEAYARLKGRADDPVAIANWAETKMRAFTGRVTPFKGKVAVLVNRYSASASEIVASALRENSSSPIVGSRTAGAVLMSTFQRLPHGFSLQYPVSDYVSIKGMRLEGNPLSPDVEVDSEVIRSDDIYETALGAIRG